MHHQAWPQPKTKQTEKNLLSTFVLPSALPAQPQTLEFKVFNIGSSMPFHGWWPLMLE